MLKALALSFLLLTSSCTWIQNYRVKSQATEQVTTNLRKTVTEEFDSTLSPIFPRKNDFIEFVLGETTVEVEDIKELPNNRYSVGIKLHTVAPEARRALLEIIKPLQGGDLNAFNFNNGLDLLKEHHTKTETIDDLRLRIGL